MPELLSRQLQPRLNCAQGNRFACRDLSLTHPFKESQMNYLLLCSGELADHSFQELSQIVVRRLGLVSSELISEFGLPFGFLALNFSRNLIIIARIRKNPGKILLTGPLLSDSKPPSKIC